MIDSSVHRERASDQARSGKGSGELGLTPALARLCGEELLSRAPQLRAAIAQRQRDLTREHAHALKGMAANFGLKVLAEALAELEAAARQPNGPIDVRMQAVEAEIPRALAALGMA